MLDCRDITVSPAGSPILRGLSLHIERGERTILVGPSGAGKTTLVRAVSGLQPLSGGSIEVNGHPVDRLPAHRRRMAVVFQEPRLLPHLRVDDNFALGCARRASEGASGDGGRPSGSRRSV